LRLETAIKHMGADSASLDPALLKCEVGSFVIDSRKVRRGDVFFALSQPEYKDNGFNGEFADGTAYSVSAFQAGALCCVLRRDRFEEHRDALSPFRDRIVLADDVIAAFQRLAHGIYLEWNRPVVAITGSAGKTTAKELTAQVLEGSGRKVLKNERNYNNGLGHPLTVLRLADDYSYDVAVLEMGMSTPNHEIERLCRITPPDVAVELNVLPVHLEHLKTIEGIAQAKAELVEGLKPSGTAVLNADDARVAAMASIAPGPVVTYGIENPADVRAETIHSERFGETVFSLVTRGERHEVAFGLDGRHNIYNALAAAAVGLRFGMSVADVALALSNAAGPAQRGEVIHFSGGFTVINDSYNSNPDALISMVKTLAGGASGRKIVVAGEMLELGPEAAAVHRDAGRSIAGLGIDHLIGVRGLASELVAGATESGLGSVEFAVDSDTAGEMLANIIKPGDSVLVKGSRGVRTEKVIDALLTRFEMEDREAAAG
jgi:UDP-N-acetylmuramoyl-tripeptide--D-alanyl-D-alanine ligase